MVSLNQNSPIRFYDCKNGFSVDNAMHYREKGRKKINKEEKEE
jgi:hypothetical protein